MLTVGQEQGSEGRAGGRERGKKAKRNRNKQKKNTVLDHESVNINEKFQSGIRAH